MAVISILELRLRDDVLDSGPAALDAILRDTRAFDGNEGIEVVHDVDDPAHVTVVERWTSIERDDAYRAWRATPEGASGLGDLLAAPPTLWRSEVRSTL